MPDDKRRFFKLGGFINKLRTVQGWNMLGPNDVVHLAAVWDEQLERKQVPECVFDELTNRAVDRRLAYIRRGEQPPTISIELILAIFEDYRSEVSIALSQAEYDLERSEREIGMLRECDGDDDLMEERIRSFQQYYPGTEITFPELVAMVAARIEKQKEKVEIWSNKKAQIQPKDR